MLFYPAAPTLSRQTLTYTAGVIRHLYIVFELVFQRSAPETVDMRDLRYAAGVTTGYGYSRRHIAAGGAGACPWVVTGLAVRAISR